MRNRRKHVGVIMNLSHYEYFTIESECIILNAYINVNVDVYVSITV